MLDSVLADLASPAFRAKAVVSVAGDLNIARRNWNAYPPGHPQTEASLQKLLESFRQLCQGSTTVQLGVTRDGLLLGAEYVEKENRICRNLAGVLFERGIGALVVQQPPNRDELAALLGLLTLKREDVFARGGIALLWQQAGIASLQVQPVRYDRFSGTEETSLTQDDQEDEEEGGSLWERFVRVLVRGDGDGLAGMDNQGGLHPELLAASLNAFFARQPGSRKVTATTISSLAAVVREAFPAAMAGGSATGRGGSIAGQGGGAGNGVGVSEESWSDLTDTTTEIKTDLFAFIAALDPGLRRQILNGFCETGAIESETAADLFNYLGPALVQETYASAEEYAAAPPLLQGILRKLLPHLDVAYASDATTEKQHASMQTLLQEHQVESYMPESYLQGLIDALASGAVRQLASSELNLLLQTLDEQAIHNRSSELILQLVLSDPTGASAQELIANLAEMCGYFLELGDYGQVLKILSQAADPRLPQPLRLAMRDAFCRREFLDEILSGLSVWGKPKYDQVALLIQVLGRAFIEPLLDRMAEEENMSLRRFMMDRVQAFGASARPYLLARLSDPRWYVLRNIILMLRAIGHPDDAEQLRPLLRHSNQKVRQESLKSLLMLGDQMAQRQVLRDLDSTDREVQLNAISMADRSSSAEMARKLLGLVTSGGFTVVECELKSAAIQALGEIGRPEVLPELVKLFALRSLLSFKALNRLKLDIVRSLERYPETAVRPLLERLAAGSDEVARQAAESLKNLKNRGPA